MRSERMGAKLGRPLIMVALLAAPAWALAQRPSASVAPVALVSDTCPAVQQGGRIALDWNPIFDPAGAASGLRSFEMFFEKLDEYGVNVVDPGPRFVARTPRVPGAVTDLVNGFYHIELTIPGNAHAGSFRLVAARARAVVYPEYKDLLPRPSMTNSPVPMRLCVTVLRAAASRPATAGN